MERKMGVHIAPSFELEAFHCPRCHVFAHQIWHQTKLLDYPSLIQDLQVALCVKCKEYSYWVNGKIAYPPCVTAPPAAEDMPASVQKYYDEARLIANHSPRSAAALLRLATKKLCEELGEYEQNLYRAIGNLRKDGLREEVIQSLDTVRIVGNEGGAHEGQIDLTEKDNEEVVDRLFKLINIIVEKTITEPKYIKETFGSLPENKRKAVADRDNS